MNNTLLATANATLQNQFSCFQVYLNISVSMQKYINTRNIIQNIRQCIQRTIFIQTNMYYVFFRKINKM